MLGHRPNDGLCGVRGVDPDRLAPPVELHHVQAAFAHFDLSDPAWRHAQDGRQVPLRQGCISPHPDEMADEGFLFRGSERLWHCFYSGSTLRCSQIRSGDRSGGATNRMRECEGNLVWELRAADGVSAARLRDAVGSERGLGRSAAVAARRRHGRPDARRVHVHHSGLCGRGPLGGGLPMGADRQPPRHRPQASQVERHPARRQPGGLPVPHRDPLSLLPLLRQHGVTWPQWGYQLQR